MDTESDFPCNFLFAKLGSFPTSPLRIGASVLLLLRVTAGAASVLGVPGDVGGRESGAELMECAPRL